MATFDNIIPLTLKKEGGLSNDRRDSASNYPSPYTYQGQTGWHTNKGITYRTFESASKEFGFENNAQNFLTMPDAIWRKIAKGKFWDSMNLDTLKSEGIAYQLFSWKWGAGIGWFSKMQDYLSKKGISWNRQSKTLADVFNQLLSKQSEKQTIGELDRLQVEYYESLNNPTFIKGWVKRIKETTQLAYSKVVDFAKKNEQNIVNYGMLGAGILILTGISYWYFKKKK